MIVAISLESPLVDLSQTLRKLRRSPLFTATAVFTLAIGIGAPTAVFTLIHQVMLRALPVAKPQQLWRSSSGDRQRAAESESAVWVTPWDPVVLSAAPVLLVLAALIAAVIPARRAASVDPAEALRAE